MPIEGVSRETQKTLLQKLQSMTPLERSRVSELQFHSRDFSADALRATLKTFQPFLTKVTLTGEWPDTDFKTLTPYFTHVTSLHLLNASFTDAAFQKAFTSDVSPVSVFDPDLDDYDPSSEVADEWDAVPVRPFERAGRPSQLILENNPWKMEPETQRPPIQQTLQFCDNLKELTIENAPHLTGDFLLKLPSQLETLRLINCPHVEVSEEVRTLFPSLQIIHN